MKKVIQILSCVLLVASMIMGCANNADDGQNDLSELQTEKTGYEMPSDTLPEICESNNSTSISDMSNTNDLTAEFCNTFDISDKIVVQSMAIQGEFIKVFNDLESVYEEAVNVVVGTVCDIQYTDDDAAPRTIYSFNVSETLKGDIVPNSLISVGESNGYVRVSTYIDVYGSDYYADLSEDEIENSVILQSIEGAPLPAVGEQYVIFLGNRKTEGRLAGAYAIMGNFMGKYVLDCDSGLYSRYIPSSNPDFYYAYKSDNQSSSTERPMSLEEIKMVIAEIS